MTKPSCCEEFEEATKRPRYEAGHFEKAADEWHIVADGGAYAVCDMKFCPYCGARVGASEKSRDGHVDAVARAIFGDYYLWNYYPEEKKEPYREQARRAMDAAFNYWREAQPCNEQGIASPEMPVAPPDRSTE